MGGGEEEGWSQGEKGSHADVMVRNNGDNDLSLSLGLLKY